MTKIIALAGSLKANSLNKKLVKIAAKGAEDAGAEVTYVDLADFNIPLFSEDLEAEGVPSGVNDLKRLFADSHAILLASPEYNGSITGVLKNALDWLSRPSKDPNIGSAFQGKVAGIMATSPGGLGGIRGLVHTKDVLFNLGVTINPKTIAVPNAYSVFDNDGNITDADIEANVKNLATQVVEMVK